MGWSVGYDTKNERDIGYGVPAVCDHPDCSEEINRGLAYVCGSDVYGGEHGCGLFFCGAHMAYSKEDEYGRCYQLCARCEEGADPFTPSEDIKEWIEWKLNDPSWEGWRNEYPSEVARLKDLVG